MKNLRGEQSGVSRQDLEEALREAHQQVLDLQSQLEEYRWTEAAIRRRTIELSERTKELECLYAIVDLLRHPGNPLADVLQGIVNVVPRGYQHPKRTWVRLEARGQGFCSPDFRRTSVFHSVGISIHGRKAGALTVYVLPPLDPNDGPAFLPEENALLQAVAVWIGEILEHRGRSPARGEDGLYPAE